MFEKQIYKHQAWKESLCGMDGRKKLWWESKMEKTKEKAKEKEKEGNTIQ